MVLRIYRLSPTVMSPFSPTYWFRERSIGSVSQKEGPSPGRTKAGDDEGMSTIFSSSYRALEWYFIGSLPPFKRPLLLQPPATFAAMRFDQPPLSPFPDTSSPFTSSSNQSAQYSTILLFAAEHLPFMERGKRRPEGGSFSDGGRRLKIVMKPHQRQAFTDN